MYRSDSITALLYKARMAQMVLNINVASFIERNFESTITISPNVV